MKVIDQVLLLQNPGESKELGRALWAAMREVEAFYNYNQKRVAFSRTYISEELFSGLLSGNSVLDAILNVFSPVIVRSKEREKRVQSEQFKKISEASWRKAKGPYSQIYKAEKIVKLVRETLAEEQRIDNLVIVTNLELIPPKHWRYIIWKGTRDGVVLSTVPTDPEYWRLIDRNRISKIKHRVRTGCLQIVGQMIGLKDCFNERCFLFDQVDSVTRLDHMVELGHEHNIKELSGRGFEVQVRNTSTVQSIIENPEPRMEES